VCRSASATHASTPRRPASPRLVRLPSRTPPRLWASADLDAVIARVAPEILALLSDGVSRTRGTVIAALAGRHPKDDVRRTLMRLAVTERLVEKGGKYSLPAPASEPG
jgi:hypothetical protein